MQSTVCVEAGATVAPALHAALEYLRRGWSVFPLLNKHRPLVKLKQYAERPPSAEEVRAWWYERPDAWVGVLLGPVSGVVRIDADGPVPLELLSSLPQSSEFATPSGGRGWLFEYDPNLSMGREVLWSGDGPHQELRYQSAGCYTVLPPSPGYSWVSSSPSVGPLPGPVKDALLSAATAAVLKSLEREYAPTATVPEPAVMLEALAHIPADDRDTWIKVGFALHSAGDEHLEHWVAWSRTSSKFVEGECEHLWAKFKRDGGVTPRYITCLAKKHGWYSAKFHEPLTDVGNGRVLTRSLNGRGLYCREWDRWLVWDGARWCEDGQLEVEAAAKKVVRDRYQAALKSFAAKLAKCADQAELKRTETAMRQVLGWCMKSEDARHVHAAIDMARSEAGAYASFRKLNCHPYLLNCANGTLDLRSGELSPHDPEQMLTQLCPTEYDPDADCPRWRQFLDEVFAGDGELIESIQRLFGYCITGSVDQHVLPIFYGTGRNGKSTMERTLKHVLGPDYCCTAPQNFLALSRYEQHPTKLVVLYSKRVVFDVETGDAMRLNEELVKRLTGGDPIQARRMHENFWEFDPTHKLVMLTNNEPHVQGTDTAIWSRLKKWPFDVSFLGREEQGLDERLRSEAKGVLAWLVQGCFEWQRVGLGEPKAVAEATAAYRHEQDHVGQFIDSCLVRDPAGRVRTDELMRLYTVWCAANGHRALNVSAFGRRMTASGIGIDPEGGRKYRLGASPARP